eukprot:2766041-Pleurochrysis_carterae.AAC.1
MENSKAFAQQMIAERTPTSVNSLYQWARKSLELHNAAPKPALVPSGASACAGTTARDGGNGRPVLRARIQQPPNER